MPDTKTTSKLKIALLCGGPSLERGISLNSARSVCDHLQSNSIEIIPIYFDHYKNPFEISRAQLYSNTPSDFDFKLQNSSKPLSKTAFSKLIKSVDLAFPVMHGPFGEDGEIQSILDQHKVPYIASDKEACKNCFDKYRANELIKKNGFFTYPSTVIKIHETPEQHKKIIHDFFNDHKITRAVVKPATGGSSIGVHSVSTLSEALDAAHKIFTKRMDTRIVIEPFCKGIEFTVIILQNRFGLPVAIFPTEVEIDYSEHQIFDYRKKYLATRQVNYHCPPRFPQDITEKIQIQAEQLFSVLGMRDFARFDGWYLPEGNIWFSDFNPISGMEQNSFLFLQSAQIGFSHSDLLKFIVRNACERNGINFPKQNEIDTTNRKPVNVLFGGNTSERQVSLMSGTNAWLKLKNSKKYEAHPYLLDLNNNSVWRLPYSKTLNHTVEEISEMCREAPAAEERLAPLRRRVLEKIACEPGHLNEELFIPEKMTLNEFIARSDFVFIGLHGGIGENGVLQKMLEDAKKPFNGSGSTASRLCIDKYATSKKLANLDKEGIHIPKKQLVGLKEVFKFSEESIKKLWKELKRQLTSSSIIVKPRADGCSTGIVRLYTARDLVTYVDLIKRGVASISPSTFQNQPEIIEMPAEKLRELMFEQFIQTDKVRVIKNKLKWEKISGWVEITMGVIGKGTKIKALNPSLTVATSDILSLEEKFQGGTGVNITPPPEPYIKKKAVEKARKRMEIVAKKLGISGYARIDAFMECDTGELLIIEANTTPALTPSTVIYHQALSENPPIYPTELMERIIELA